MIQDGVMFVCFLLAFTALIAVVEKKIGGKFFKYVPGIVLIYIGAALMKTFGVFSDSDSVESAYSTIRGAPLACHVDAYAFAMRYAENHQAWTKDAVNFFCGFIQHYWRVHSYLRFNEWLLCGRNLEGILGLELKLDRGLCQYGDLARHTRCA